MHDPELIESLLVAQLKDPVGKVILLTGPWGCGKTYLWRKRVARALKDREPTYITVFGADSIASIIHSLLDAAAPKRPAGPSGVASMTHLQSGLIVCLDDIERVSRRVQIEEVLGLATALAETKSCRVLLIMDVEQLDEVQRAVVGRFRERVVTSHVTASANLGTLYDLRVADADVEPAVRGLLVRVRPTVLGVFGRTNNQNLRTLGRVLTYLVMVARNDLSDACTDEHVMCATALRMEADAGRLEDAAFYGFNEIFLRMSPGPGDARSPEQRGFLDRYFEPGNFEFSPSAYRYIADGYVSPERLGAELRPPPSVTTALDEVMSYAGRAYYASDDEALAYSDRVLAALSDSSAITARDILSLAMNVQVALNRAGKAIPIKLAELVRARLNDRAALDTEDDRATTLLSVSGEADYYEAFLDEYEAARRNSAIEDVHARLAALIAAGDESGFSSALHQHPTVLQALFDGSLLNELMESFAANRRFHDRACSMVLRELRANSAVMSDAEALSESFRKRLAGMLDHPRADNSDRWRFRRLLGIEE